MATTLEDMAADKSSLPKEVNELLMELWDIMPPEPPKSLPPKRYVYQSELEFGSKAFARAPYWMSQP